MNNKSDIRVGAAVVPWCQKEKAWLLPEGKNQRDRRVFKREVAVIFCHRLSQLIGGGV